MKEDEKKKYVKVQRDFNKALTMALKLKHPHTSNTSLSPSIKKEEPTHQSTSIKILPNSEVKNVLPQIKPLPSKTQSKSLT